MKCEAHKTVTCYQPALCKISKERRTLLHRSRSLKSRSLYVTSPTSSTNWTFRACLTNAFVNRWQTPALRSTYEVPFRRHLCSAQISCACQHNKVKIHYILRVHNGIFRCFNIFDEIKEDEMCVPCVGMITSTCKGLVGKSDGKNLLRICMHRRDDNIKAGRI
jgi:hypothetical protein